MKYTYNTATGTIAVEINEHWLGLLAALDRDEFNSERKHSRRHPISLESCRFKGDWFEDRRDPVSEVETALDIELALVTLTDLQRNCFVETRMNCRPQQEVAAMLGKSRPTIRKAAEGAAGKLKIFFA